MTEAEYLPFVRRIANALARRAWVSPADRDDLVGAGALALAKALTRFDPARGVRFTTFAAYAVQGAMLDHLRSLDPLGRRTRVRVKRDHLPQPVVLVPELAAAQVPAPTPDPLRRLWARELVRRTTVPKDRRVVALLYWGGAWSSEVARAWGVTDAAIENRKRRALAQMRAAA